MSELDKWGLKGLRTLMSNYPDYNAMATGIDPAELGLDLNTTECVTQPPFVDLCQMHERTVLTDSTG